MTQMMMQERKRTRRDWNAGWKVVSMRNQCVTAVMRNTNNHGSCPVYMFSAPRVSRSSWKREMVTRILCQKGLAYRRTTLNAHNVSRLPLLPIRELKDLPLDTVMANILDMAAMNDPQLSAPAAKQRKGRGEMQRLC